MMIDFSKQSLPPIYQRKNKDCYFDPIREKLIYITPEETVSGKVSELRQFVAEQYPDIIDGNKFNLGTMVNDHLWNLDEPDMMKVIENMISYALVRDEYRNYVKNK